MLDSLRRRSHRRSRPSRTRAALTSAFAVVTAALIAGGASQLALAANEAEPASATSATQQWLTGYWHNFDNGSTVLTLADIPSEYNLVAVAFADNHPSLDGGITFNLASSELNGYTDAQFRSDIAAIQAEGRKVVLSVGGQLGNVSVTNPTQARNFADTAHALMQDYGFDGIDIDLEHGINAQYMESALRDLRASAGTGLIITMAPQTIDFQAPTQQYYQLASNISDILTIVNMQYYNSGTMAGCDGQIYAQGTPDFVAAQACIQLEMGLSPGQVGLGLPAVPSAAGGGHMPTSDIIAALDCLEAGTSCGQYSPTTPYGPIGGVMTWSVNWDATNNYQFARDISARLGNGPTTPPTTPPPTTPPPSGSPTDTPPPGDCTDPAWSAETVYTGGETVSHQGNVYRAKWWTRGEEPGTTGQWGVWETVRTC